MRDVDLLALVHAPEVGVRVSVRVQIGYFEFSGILV